MSKKNRSCRLYLFDQDIGEGKVMLYGVLGGTANQALNSLKSVLKSGKICEPDNPNTKIVRVDVKENGSRTTVFKLFGYDEQFEKLCERR